MKINKKEAGVGPYKTIQEGDWSKWLADGLIKQTKNLFQHTQGNIPHVTLPILFFTKWAPKSIIYSPSLSHSSGWFLWTQRRPEYDRRDFGWVVLWQAGRLSRVDWCAADERHSWCQSRRHLENYNFTNVWLTHDIEHQLKGKYHCTADHLFILFGFNCFTYVDLATALLVWSNPNESNRRSAKLWY